jgi:hypothetical protein
VLSVRHLCGQLYPCSDDGRLVERRGGKERENDDTNDHNHLANITPSKHTPHALKKLKATVASDGPLRPFLLLRQDVRNLRERCISDWTVFNQLIFASAVYVFFTNLLLGISFASDLYVLTGKSWGTIEVVLSTGLCGLIFSLCSIQPPTILGVTSPFSSWRRTCTICACIRSMSRF